MKVPGTTIVKVTNSKINGLNAKNNTTERTKRTHELLPHVQGQESLIAKSSKNPHEGQFKNNSADLAKLYGVTTTDKPNSEDRCHLLIFISTPQFLHQYCSKLLICHWIGLPILET